MHQCLGHITGPRKDRSAARIRHLLVKRSHDPHTVAVALPFVEHRQTAGAFSDAPVPA